MTATIQGTVGIEFDIEETDLATATGNVVQDHTISTDVSAISLASTDTVYSVSGSVGTTAFDFDLNAVDNQSGTGYSTSVVRNNGGDFTTMKSIVIHNTHATGVITVTAAAANSFLTASEQITLKPGMSVNLLYTTAEAVSTNGKLNIVSDTATTTFKMYLLGT